VIFSSLMGFRRSLRDLREFKNLEVYSVLALALILSLLHALHVVDTRVVGAIAIVLFAVICWQILESRQERDALAETLTHVEDLLEHFTPQEFIRPWSAHKQIFTDRLRAAKTFSLVAIGPVWLMKDYEDDLIRLVRRQDGRIRFLIVSPDSKAMELICRLRPESKIETQGIIDYYLPRLYGESLQGGQIAVRSVDYVPSCVVSMMDEDTENPIVFATISSWDQADPNRPSIRLDPRTEPAEFLQFFKHEFETLWNNSSDIPIQDSGTKPGVKSA